MNVEVGNRVEMKKPHPCGGNTFEILRVGMDFKIRCLTCGREVWRRAEKSRKTSEKSSENNYVRKDRNF